jgi:hypothetical protein
MDAIVLTLCIHFGACSDLAVYPRLEPCLSARAALLAHGGPAVADHVREGEKVYCRLRSNARQVAVRAWPDVIRASQMSERHWTGRPEPGAPAASAGNSKAFGPEDVPLAISYTLGDIVMVGLIGVAFLAPRY